MKQVIKKQKKKDFECNKIATNPITQLQLLRLLIYVYSVVISRSFQFWVDGDAR